MANPPPCTTCWSIPSRWPRCAGKVADNLWVAGSDINLAAAEVELAGVVGREVILRDLLLQDEGAFDFVFMDCARRWAC